MACRLHTSSLRIFAGAERGARVSQVALNCTCERVLATEHAPRGPFRVLERRDGLAEIVERGGRVLAERHRVTTPDPERELMTFPKNASCHGHRSAHQRLGFLVAL